VERGSYAPGDLVTINAGINAGIAVGQEYYTRRTLSALDDPAVDNPDMALATLSHACDTIDVGDYLEPFAPPIVTPVRADAPATTSRSENNRSQHRCHSARQDTP
jgi:hypothetical protein